MSDTYLPPPPISGPLNSQMIPPQGMMVPMGSDDLLIVRFYKKPVHNAARSKELGSPYYDSIDYVYIQQPGERDYADRPAHDGDKARFYRKWQQYQNNIEQVPEGTPLAVLFVDPNDAAIPPFLNGIGIYTVEQLAGLTEVAIQNIGLGGRDWCNKATKYLEYARKGQGYHKIDRDLAAANNKIDVLTQQLEGQKRQIDQLLAERYGQTAHPNVRSASHRSVMEQQYAPPPPAPMLREEAPPDAFQLNSDDRPPPVFRDPGQATEPKRRGGWPKGKPRKVQST